MRKKYVLLLLLSIVIGLSACAVENTPAITPHVPAAYVDTDNEIIDNEDVGEQTDDTLSEDGIDEPASDDVSEDDVESEPETNEPTVYVEPETESEVETEQSLPIQITGLTEATVTRVIDGDTIEISTGERIRFIGVNTPEAGEPGAGEAVAFVRSHALNQTVWLEADGDNEDRFGRLRRYVWLQMPTDLRDAEQIQRYQLNALLLSNGLAEVSIFGVVQNEALFRSIAVPLVYATAPTPAPEQTPTPTQATGSFIGNINSQIFHSPTCNSLPAARNRIYFDTREDALAAGHRACQRCRP